MSVMFADLSSDGRSSIETMLASAAMAEDKTVGEYMNNAVTRLCRHHRPGDHHCSCHDQDKSFFHHIAFPLSKSACGNSASGTDAFLPQAVKLAGGVGGRVLNVAEIKASVPFDTATVIYLNGRV